MKINALFRKTDGSFTTFIDDDSLARFPLDHFWVKTFEVQTDTFDLARYRLEGNYENARIVDLVAEKKSVVTEQEIESKYQDLFYRKYYELTGKVFDMHDFVFELFDEGDILNQLKTFRKKLLERKAKEIQMYKDSEYHIFETLDDQIKREKEIFK